jgi:hypothetical protein
MAEQTGLADAGVGPEEHQRRIALACAAEGLRQPGDLGLARHARALRASHASDPDTAYRRPETVVATVPTIASVVRVGVGRCLWLRRGRAVRRRILAAWTSACRYLTSASSAGPQSAVMIVLLDSSFRCLNGAGEAGAGGSGG